MFLLSNRVKGFGGQRFIRLYSHLIYMFYKIKLTFFMFHRFFYRHALRLQSARAVQAAITNTATSVWELVPLATTDREQPETAKFVLHSVKPVLLSMCAKLAIHPPSCLMLVPTSVIVQAAHSWTWNRSLAEFALMGNMETAPITCAIVAIHLAELAMVLSLQTVLLVQQTGIRMVHLVSQRVLPASTLTFRDVASPATVFVYIYKNQTKAIL